MEEVRLATSVPALYPSVFTSLRSFSPCALRAASPLWRKPLKGEEFFPPLPNQFTSNSRENPSPAAPRTNRIRAHPACPHFTSCTFRAAEAGERYSPFCREGSVFTVLVRGRARSGAQSEERRSRTGRLEECVASSLRQDIAADRTSCRPHMASQ